MDIRRSGYSYRRAGAGRRGKFGGNSKNTYVYSNNVRFRKKKLNWYLFTDGALDGVVLVLLHLAVRVDSVYVFGQISGIKWTLQLFLHPVNLYSIHERRLEFNINKNTALFKN